MIYVVQAPATQHQVRIPDISAKKSANGFSLAAMLLLQSLLVSALQCVSIIQSPFGIWIHFLWSTSYLMTSIPCCKIYLVYSEMTHTKKNRMNGRPVCCLQLNDQNTTELSVPFRRSQCQLEAYLPDILRSKIKHMAIVTLHVLSLLCIYWQKIPEKLQAGNFPCCRRVKVAGMAL